jgi:3-dehydroquinate dehydratase II
MKSENEWIISVYNHASFCALHSSLFIRKMKTILIINGPNLNLLGRREPAIYGSRSFDEYLEMLQAQFTDVTLHYVQSNHEGALIDAIHEWGFSADGIVINAGALTHTSIALADALTAVTAPAVEVHISNVHARESFRHHSYLSARCKGVIVGLGLTGYELAVRYLLAEN